MMKYTRSDEIEKRSFEIITQKLGIRAFEPEQEMIIKRTVHTTADFDYADLLAFSENAVKTGIHALKKGCDIVTDTQMAKAGINKRILNCLGGEVHCFMSDSDVAEEAKKRNITRAVASMEKAAAKYPTAVFAIGNAPTALMRLIELEQEGKIKPSLVIGVPVGFVNVVESKELLLASEIPYIAVRGNKGGSTVAAAICNALLYQIMR